MYVIGLTGGIGSGKTTVANLFAKLGITIIDTDQLAREVIDHAALQKIIAQFGPEILAKDGSLDRGKLRALVFSDAEKRLWLEQLLHPLILDKMQQKIEAVESPYCIAVIPLLFETNPNPIINRILVVDATENQQIDRTRIRDGLSREDIELILKAQVPRQHRLTKANDVIYNHGDLSDLKKEVDKFHQIYLSLAKSE